MSTLSTDARRAFITLIQRSSGIALLLLLLLSGAQAQTSPTDGTTPLALSPGAPAGSYALSGFDNVNLYNGHLNFNLPLLQIGGRGGARMTLPLPIERTWRIEENAIPLPGGGVNTIFIAQPNWWMGLEPYGLGKLAARHVGEGETNCGGRNLYVITLTRLTFTAPDGTEYELRDQQSNGQPARPDITCATEVSRGQVFVTADGTAATFISDTVIYDQIINPGPPGGPDITTPSGFLMMRDGTRYRIDNGQVSWLRDRNGNKLTVTYGPQSRVSMITDSLNRKVTICYAFTAACGNPSYDLITFQGFAGAPRTIRVWYANLGDVLRTAQPGDIGTPRTMSQLFPEVQLGNRTQVFNPRVISAVELPNNQTYQFRYNVYGELARVALPTGGTIEYDHAAGVVGGPASGVTGGGDVYRRMVARRVYLDGTTGSLAELMTYSRPESLLGEDLDYVVVDHYKPDGVTRLKQERHYFHGKVTDSFILTPTQYSPWKHGRERQTEYLGADGSTALRRVVNTWQQRPAATWFDPNTDGRAAERPSNRRDGDDAGGRQPGFKTDLRV